MKITIELNEAEVKGIKAYLKAVDDIPNPNKDDIKGVVNSFVNAIHSPHEAISSYIAEAQTKIECKKS